MAKKRKSLSTYFSFWPMVSSWVLGNIRFVLFLAFLGVLYIGISRQAESNIRNIHLLTKEVRKLRWEYMSLQSELMYSSTQSEVIQTMKSKGFVVDKKGPKRIVVKKNLVKLEE